MTTPSAAGRALADRLNEISRILESIDSGVYGEVREDGVSGSVGAHVRHVIDHVTALVEPAVQALVDYDSRRRHTLVEHHQPTAIAELRRLAFLLSVLPDTEESRACRLSAVVSPDGRRVETATLFGRELVFVLSHTIHHQAIIALLLAAAGLRTPARFGLAPSTPSFAPCAQSA